MNWADDLSFIIPNPDSSSHGEKRNCGEKINKDKKTQRQSHEKNLKMKKNERRGENWTEFPI